MDSLFQDRKATKFEIVEGQNFEETNIETFSRKRVPLREGIVQRFELEDYKKC